MDRGREASMQGHRAEPFLAPERTLIALTGPLPPHRLVREGGSLGPERESDMKMLIDGQWVDASDGKTLEIRNPATGQRLGEVPLATKEDAQRAVEAAVRCKARMAQVPAHRRSKMLIEVADRIEQQRDDLVRSLTLENGRPFSDINAWDIDVTIRVFRGFAEECRRMYGVTVPLDAYQGHENSFALTTYQPVGVIAAIVPFNYPVELWAHKAAAGLAAGNVVISKPPEECPLTILRVAEFIEEAGFPAGAHQVLTGRGEVVGAFLAQAPGVDMITMTGSSEVGRSISKAAAATLKKVSLELSGNDATIVMESADPKVAAAALVAGRFTHGNGQICCAVKRVILADKIYDQVLDEVLALTHKLKIGDPIDPATDVGPLISEAAAVRVETQLQKAKSDGATLLVGGGRQRNFIQPAVLVDVNIDSDAFQEEIFGPVLVVVRAFDIEHAIQLANHSNFGLQAAIFTDDLQQAMNAALRIEAATVIVNQASAMRVECLPFGGIKNSGNNREGMMTTLKEMTEIKTVIFNQAFNLYETH